MSVFVYKISYAHCGRCTREFYVRTVMSRTDGCVSPLGCAPARNPDPVPHLLQSLNTPTSWVSGGPLRVTEVADAPRGAGGASRDLESNYGGENSIGGPVVSKRTALRTALAPVQPGDVIAPCLAQPCLCNADVKLLMSRCPSFCICVQ